MHKHAHVCYEFIHAHRANVFQAQTSKSLFHFYCFYPYARFTDARRVKSATAEQKLFSFHNNNKIE